MIAATDAAWVILFLGFVLLLLVRLLDVRYGLAGGTVALVVGLVFEGVAAVVGWEGGHTSGVIAAASAILILGWCAVAFVLFRARRGRVHIPPFQHGADHCVPKLVQGGGHSENEDYDTLRIILVAQFDVAPGDSMLWEQAYAFGDYYYGLGYWYGQLTLTPKVDLTCREDEGKCLITASQSGKSEDTDGPLRLVITNVSDAPWGTSGDSVSITTVMGASVATWGGGASITATPQTGWVSMSFPDAPKSCVFQMQTRTWKCRKQTSTAPSHAGVAPRAG